MQTYDVLIVGGGLTGASLALALKRLGFAIALVEEVSSKQRWNSSAGDRALALAKGSVEIFHDLGVWAKVAEKATPIKHIHVSDRGHFGKTRLDAQEVDVDAFGQVVLARSLEQAVAAACVEQRIEMLCPACVIGLRLGSNAVEAKLVQDERLLNYRARLVVAADGGQSRIRKWIGIGQKVYDYNQTALVSTIRPERSHCFTAFERFTASGTLALLPLPKGQSALIWTCSKEEAKSAQTLSSSQFEERLQEKFGWKLGRLKLVAPLCSFPLRLILAERLFAERVALVGNAAHQLHPVAGQGLNLGLRDVAVLARLLREHLCRGRDPGEFTLLERYAKMRLFDHRLIIGFSHGLVQWFTPLIPPLALARNLGLVALDHWPLGKRLLAYQAMGMEW